MYHREWGGRGGNSENQRGHMGNHDEREGARCKISYINSEGWGHYFFFSFSFPFINWKKGRRAIRV